MISVFRRGRGAQARWLCGIACVAALFCINQGLALGQGNSKKSAADQDASEDKKVELETATFANGCFWCTEAVFLQLKGVHSVVSGYIGGSVDNPTYKQVTTGMTGHAECIQIQFDPEVISFDKLLEVFWATHDPTTLNRQGPDIGTQYRSGVFYHNERQRERAEYFKRELNAANAFGAPIVTEITAATKFYPAEDYHQNYYAQNKSQPYCRAMIKPKLDKLKKVFADQLKK